MDMSFQEKSIIGSLIITIFLFGGYFLDLFSTLIADSSVAFEGTPGALIGVTVSVIVVEAIYQVIIATISKDEAEDERDKLISAKATVYAYYILVAGCLLSVGHLLFASLLRQPDTWQLNPLMTANMIVFWFILAEVVGFSLRLYYYRRGV